jgi:hypothetical protein
MSKKKNPMQMEIINFLKKDISISELTQFLLDRQTVPLTPMMKGMIFLKYSGVDENGYSREVEIDELIKLHPDFTTIGKNGCDWAGDNRGLGLKYEVRRSHFNNAVSGRITSIQLLGIKKDKRTRSIRPDIYDKVSKRRCSILDIGSNIEVDHKNGRYDDEATQSLETQKESDFQSLSKTANDAKRFHCLECKKTNCRYDAKRLGYCCSWVEGGLEHSKYGCPGCYWHDPRHFNEVASANFGK